MACATPTDSGTCPAVDCALPSAPTSRGSVVITCSGSMAGPDSGALGLAFRRVLAHVGFTIGLISDDCACAIRDVAIANTGNNATACAFKKARKGNKG